MQYVSFQELAKVDGGVLFDEITAADDRCFEDEVFGWVCDSLLLGVRWWCANFGEVL